MVSTRLHSAAAGYRLAAEEKEKKNANLLHNSVLEIFPIQEFVPFWQDIKYSTVLRRYSLSPPLHL